MPKSSILLTTGADTSFSLMNIYDLAGNVWEWTLEKTPSDSTPCALRGGYYGNYSAERPASYRYNATTAQAITTMVLASVFHFFSS